MWASVNLTLHTQLPMATPAPASALALTRLFFVHKQPNSHLKFLVPTKTTTLKTTIPLLCSATNKPPSPSSLTTTQISSSARIRSEVLSPFRSVRMFFYLAFIASGGLGGLIATTQLISSLVNPNSTRDSIEIVKGLGIDVIAVSLFAFLYFRENNAKNAQLARLSREESLSNLKLRVDESRVINVSSLRGAARLVVVAGPTDFVKEAFERSKLFTDKLVERGVLVVPFVTDGGVVKFDFEEEGGEGEELEKRKKLWQLVPFSVSDWAMWLDEQKKLANVSPEAPVYISLRMDGRVRGSGVGYPPWNAFVAQLPPVKGLWSGLLDGMDGRVL